MCGIAGIISFHPGQVSEQRLRLMTDAIAHRGPDGEGWWMNNAQTAGFGHRMLSIIDISDANRQPMHYLNRYTIVFNGEIYNYPEVREALVAKGYRFRTQSDTEVILAAYACYNTACLQHFDGMFAFAIWDEQEQTFFAARDRFGEKPFYYHYHQRSHQLLFASEMKALWKAGVEKKLNSNMLYNYFTLGYVQNPHDASETSYVNIKKLPAGAYLQYANRQFNGSTHNYWTLDTGQVTAVTNAAATEQFSSLFSTSVKRRLRSDVPLGASLSGGLDSSSIVAEITRQQHTGSLPALQTFSAVFPGYEKNESAYISMVCEAFAANNHQVQPTAAGLVNDFEQLCYHQEEPFGSASLYAQFKVFALAKQHNITVLLDGQGADEILAGYTNYYSWYWQELYRSNKENLQYEIQAARNTGVSAQWNWKNKLAATFPLLSRAVWLRLRPVLQQNTAGLSKDFMHAYGKSHYAFPLPGLNSILHYNTCTNGLEELLRYADRNAMAHGREVRLPFLYHELVQYLFSLPAHVKIHNGWSKWLLRESMKNTLPQTIVWRTGKIGFEPPQKKWMECPTLRECIHEAKKQLVSAGILRPGMTGKKNQPHESYAADNTDWRYLVVAALMRI